MPDSRTAAALIAQMEASASIIDGLIAKARGGGPKAEPAAPEGLGSGSRTYTVTDWMPTCSRCRDQGRCGESPRQCGKSSWFPIEHRVTLSLVGGSLVGAVCREGRKGDRGGCRDGGGCRHVARAVDAMAGREARGVELSTVVGAAERVPVCPNCHQRWGVSASSGGRKAWECRNPVCSRDGASWEFDEGDADRPKPMRHGLVIRDRDPGREVVRR